MNKIYKNKDINKIYTVMKATFTMLLLSTSMILAENAYSQKARVSMEMLNTQMEIILNEIENQTDYLFLYNGDNIDVSRYVSVNAKETPVAEVLNNLFDGTGVNFVMEGTHIVLTKKNSRSDEKDALLEAASKQANIAPPGNVRKRNEALTRLLQQQGKRITGTVIDEAGEPVIGATIAEKGTTIGTATNSEGMFTITVTGTNSVLQISYVGYITQEITVGNQSSLYITLLEDVQRLEDVVVIGYGTVKKRDLTGSVTSVRADDILKTNSPTLNVALQTQIPADVKSGWQPGDNPSIEIRGINSITGSNSPLWVVDGIPMQSSSVNINTYDIASVDILQDASATAIYGARGANGVIIITTKRAEAGEQKITASYNGWAGFDQATRKPELMNGKQFEAFKRAAWINSGKASASSPDESFFDAVELASLAAGTDTDWFDLVWGGSAFAMNHNFTLNASGLKTGTTLSLGYLDQSSLIPTAGFKRYNLNFSNEYKFSERLKFKTKILGSYTKNDHYPGAVDFVYQLSPLGTAYDEDGNLKLFSNPGEVLVTNPLMEAENSQNEVWEYGAIGSASMEWRIWDGLKYEISVGADFTTTDNGSYQGSETYARKGGSPSASYTTSTAMTTLLNTALSYEKQFGGIHQIGAMIDYSAEKYFSRGSYISATDMYFDALYYNLESASTILGKSTSLTEWALESYLGRLNYTLMERYLLTFSFRRDGSSRLPEGNKWVQYPSLSVAWRLSEEPFMASLKDSFLDNLKIRLSWGNSGNMTISPYSTLGRLSTTYYAWDETGVMGTIPSSIPNKQLVWEKTAEYNFGLDFNLFKSRLNGTLELYDKNTDGLIMSRNLPQTSGFSSYQQNIGKTRNRGVQLQLKGDIIRNRDIVWNVGFTFYKNKNEIIDLYGDNKDDVGSNWFIGQPVRVWYLYDFVGVWQEDEVELAAKYGAKPGYPKFRDVTNPSDGTIRINPDEDRVVISKEPKWIGSWNTTLTYKNWDLYINMNTRQGQLAASNVHLAGGGDPGRYNVINENYWTPENKSNTDPAPWAAGRYANFGSSDWWLRDVSFVRLSNISLGYTLPKDISKKILSDYAKIYINVTNPYVWSSYKGQDPQVTDPGTYPAVTSYQLGINLNF